MPLPITTSFSGGAFACLKSAGAFTVSSSLAHARKKGRQVEKTGGAVATLKIDVAAIPDLLVLRWTTGLAQGLDSRFKPSAASAILRCSMILPFPLAGGPGVGL
jgi:hypothetical protein